MTGRRILGRKTMIANEDPAEWLIRPVNGQDTRRLDISDQ